MHVKERAAKLYGGSSRWPGVGGGQVVFPAKRANQQNVWKTWSESSVDMSQVDLEWMINMKLECHFSCRTLLVLE